MRTPDGGWRGEGKYEGHLRLDAAQFEAVKALHARALSSRGALDKAMQSIGKGQHSGRWARLDTSVKSLDSLCRKAALSGRTPDRYPKIFQDVNRYTRVHSPEKYAAGVEADIAKLKKLGYQQKEDKNNWQQSTNRDINSKWLDPQTNQLFEIQFHTEDSLKATERTHSIYEYSRLGNLTKGEARAADYLQYLEVGKFKPPRNHGKVGKQNPTSIPPKPSDEALDDMRKKVRAFAAYQRALRRGDHPPVRPEATPSPVDPAPADPAPADPAAVDRPTGGPVPVEPTPDSTMDGHGRDDGEQPKLEAVTPQTPDLVPAPSAAEPGAGRPVAEPGTGPASGSEPPAALAGEEPANPDLGAGPPAGAVQVPDPVVSQAPDPGSAPSSPAEPVIGPGGEPVAGPVSQPEAPTAVAGPADPPAGAAQVPEPVAPQTPDLAPAPPSASELLAGPDLEPAGPGREPVADSSADPSADSSADPSADSSADPGAEPSADSSAEPNAVPNADPAAKGSPETAAAPETVAGPGGEPAANGDVPPQAAEAQQPADSSVAAWDAHSGAESPSPPDSGPAEPGGGLSHGAD